MYSSWICDNVESPLHEPITKKKEIKMGFILMERMEYTLTKYIQLMKSDFIKNKKLIKNMYKELIEKMLTNKFVNTDLHFSNIMINLNSNNIPIKLRFIDWGYTKSTEGTRGYWSVGKMIDSFDCEIEFHINF